MRAVSLRGIFGAVASAALIWLAAGVPARAAGQAPPAGFEVTERHQVAPGLERMTLVAHKPPRVVHVARMAAGAPLELRAVLSNDAVAGPGPRLERTSSMCVRVNCLVAVNGDFAAPEAEHPVGAMVTDGELVRSPVSPHHQLVVGPTGATASPDLAWRGRLVSTDLRELALSGVNVGRSPDALVMYTPRFGPSTATNPHGVELVGELVDVTAGVPLGHTVLVRMTALRADAGDTPIPSNGIVLSGHGRAADALADLWRRVESGSAGREALLRLETDMHAAQAIGAWPILVRDGRRWFQDAADGFTRDRHPRTAVGRTASGDTLLVAVDGRNPAYSVGMTLAETADLMIGLGAIEAVNLDGGGSTTFTVGGAVTNRPSDQLVERNGTHQIVHTAAAGDAVVGNVERPVVSALAVVRAGAPQPAPAPRQVALPSTIPLRVPLATDPGSNAEVALPAVIPLPAGTDAAPPVLAAVAAIVLAAAAGATGVTAARARPCSAGSRWAGRDR